jgi:3-hydroxypropanoate dehydrogenase
LAQKVSEEALKQIFTEARTHRSWTQEPVSLETLQAIYDTMKFGPTSANMSPMRVVFVTTQEGKDRLLPLMAEANREKTASAPVSAIFAYDPKFYDRMDFLFPGRDFKSMFAANLEMAERAAFQNGTLQVAYFMIAARAYGVDCGPMTGFDNAGVDKEFFSESGWKSNIVCNLGHGDGGGMFPRLPRFDFNDVSVVI